MEHKKYKIIETKKEIDLFELMLLVLVMIGGISIIWSIGVNNFNQMSSIEAGVVSLFLFCGVGCLFRVIFDLKIFKEVKEVKTVEIVGQSPTTKVRGLEP